MKKYKSQLKEIKILKESNSFHYEASIMYIVHEDSYEEGEGEQVNSWDNNIKDNTLKGLLQKVAREVNAKNYTMLDYQGNMNDYDWGTELWWNYLGDNHNNEASKMEIEKWKKDELQLYSVNAHIIISKVGKSPVSEMELKQIGIKI
jgi:hypothetical protein